MQFISIVIPIVLCSTIVGYLIYCLISFVIKFLEGLTGRETKYFSSKRDRIILSIFLLIIFLYLLGTARAGQYAYTCEIKQVYCLTDAGTVRPCWGGVFIGDKFAVSRKDGQIIGNTITTILAKGTHVINKGENGWNFRAIAYFAKTWQLIEIQEYKDTEEKPFISVGGGPGIVTGICK